MREVRTQDQVRDTIAQALRGEGGVAQVAFDAPLFDGSLGLDSVDMVSVIVAVEHCFGLEFPDGTDFAERFRSIDTIAQFVEELRSAS